MQLAARGGDRAVGDSVDAWSNDGWWESEVTDVQPARRSAVVAIAGQLEAVSLDDLRSTVQWALGSGWAAVAPGA
jgi:hypothetical protein